MFSNEFLKTSSTFSQFVYIEMFEVLLSLWLPQTILISLCEGSNDKSTLPSILKGITYPAMRELSYILIRALYTEQGFYCLNV